MIDLENKIRENIKNLKPYSSARDEFSGSEGVFLDANENPYGNFNRYPDPHQSELKEIIASVKELRPENIFLGNGSDEAIDIAYRIFCEPGLDRALIFTPTYGMYEVAAGINNILIENIPLDKVFQINLDLVKPLLADKNLKLIFICSPNNPTGNTISREDIEFILTHFNGIVIIDEAYIDFSQAESYILSIKKYNNLIVLQTFSKAWALAGARIGMAFSNERIINYFNIIKPPYNISSLNQQAVIKKLNEIEIYQKNLSKILRAKDFLKKALEEISFIKRIYPSEANFFLAEVTDANSIYLKLLNEKIIVRNRTHVIANCLRITIGSSDENQKLITALKKIEHG